MKTFIIGRQEDCDIVISDPTQMVSRHHAVLTVSGSKMTITDQSSNGTYINGIRIAAGAPVPVTRRDVVSFAQSAELNWARIPDTGKKTALYLLMAVVVAIALVVGGKYAYDTHKGSEYGKFQADSSAMAKLKADVDVLEKDYVFIETKTDSLKKVLATVSSAIDKKQSSKELNSLIKDVAQVEMELRSVNVPAFQEELIGLRAAMAYENRPNELAKKLRPLQEKAESYKQSLKKSSTSLREIGKALGDMPEKSRTPQQPKPETKPDQGTNNVIMNVAL